MNKGKTKSTTALTVSGQFSEGDIPKLLEQVNNKIKQLVGDREQASRITGELMGHKVSEVKDAMLLRELYGYITQKSKVVGEFDGVFKLAAPMAKLPEYKEGGATVKQWQEEIIIQYKEVTHEEVINKLKETKKALEECLSEEAKKQAKLQNVGLALEDLLNN